jgi:hypothetical protein
MKGAFASCFPNPRAALVGRLCLARPTDLLSVTDEAPLTPALRVAPGFALCVRAFSLVASGPPVALRVWSWRSLVLLLWHGSLCRTVYGMPRRKDGQSVCAQFVCACTASDQFDCRPPLQHHPLKPDGARCKTHCDHVDTGSKRRVATG